MPDQSPPSADSRCPFCEQDPKENAFLYEAKDFFVMADHAPLADAHLLLVPRKHYPCLAALPPELDAEFEYLKASLGGFVLRNYGALTFWENGGFAQSVPHAHLHAIALHLEPEWHEGAGASFSGLAGLRALQSGATSPYFMLEYEGHARLFPPDLALYLRIVESARKRNGGYWLLPRERRREEGRAVIDRLQKSWRESWTLS